MALPHPSPEQTRVRLELDILASELADEDEPLAAPPQSPGASISRSPTPEADPDPAA